MVYALMREYKHILYLQLSTCVARSRVRRPPQLHPPKYFNICRKYCLITLIIPDLI